MNMKRNKMGYNNDEYEKDIECRKTIINMKRERIKYNDN